MLKGNVAISLLFYYICFYIIRLKFIIKFFVCTVLIGVKSKYGSVCGSRPGFMNLNKRKVPFVGMTG
jgi:hypothetical protein